MSNPTAEALARVEHKVDIALSILMKILGSNAPLPEMKDGSHSCPVCKVGVKYIVDLQHNTVSRQCGCKTGKFAPIDLEQFKPPMIGRKSHESNDGDDRATDDGGSSGSGGGGSGSSRRR